MSLSFQRYTALHKFRTFVPVQRNGSFEVSPARFRATGASGLSGHYDMLSSFSLPCLFDTNTKKIQIFSAL